MKDAGDKWKERVHLAAAGVGAIGGMFGILAICVTFYDRVAPIQIDVGGVMPVSVYDRMKEPEEFRGYIRHGIAAVVEVENGRRASFITGIEVIGNVDLRYDEYKAYFDRGENGDPIGKYHEEWQIRRPYLRVRWQGAVESESGQLRLEPGEKAYVKFVLRQPESWLPLYPAHAADSLGCRDGSRTPTSWFPDAKPDYIFAQAIPSKVATGLRQELRSGQLRFRLFVNNQAVEIPPEQLTVGRAIEKKEWSKTPGAIVYRTIEPGPYNIILE